MKEVRMTLPGDLGSWASSWPVAPASRMRVKEKTWEPSQAGEDWGVKVVSTGWSAMRRERALASIGSGESEQGPPGAQHLVEHRTASSAG
jgi:hypothetical protein